MKEIQIGSVWEQDIVVTDQLLACAVGSGEVRVYATPMMIALMENTAAVCLKPFLDEGETSVGVSISTTHAAATPCGMKVSVKAQITAIDRRKVSFKIIARDEIDLIGEAEHDRFVVDKEKFEQRTEAKKIVGDAK